MSQDNDGFKVADRVHIQGQDKKGRIVNIRDRRADVQWDNCPDNELPEVVNLVRLRLAPKPALSGFCGYCLINFKLRLANKPGETGDSQVEDVVANTSNGIAYHVRCAREIKRAIEQYDIAQMGKELKDGPASQ
jgi:hypothetical protein